MISRISRTLFYINQLVGSIVCQKRSDQMSVSFAQKNSTIWLEVFFWVTSGCQTAKAKNAEENTTQL